MKKNVFISAGLIVCFLFFLFKNQPVDYEKIANSITIQTAKKLETEKKLHLVGTGGGMMNDIKMMAMSFNYYHEVDVKEARKLAIHAANQYLSAINNNKDVRPFLHEYPFTPKNIQIRIFVYKPDRSLPPQDKLQFISVINSNITYSLNDPMGLFEEVYKESFEEALRLSDLSESNSDECTIFTTESNQ